METASIGKCFVEFSHFLSQLEKDAGKISLPHLKMGKSEKSSFDGKNVADVAEFEFNFHRKQIFL